MGIPTWIDVFASMYKDSNVFNQGVGEASWDERASSAFLFPFLLLPLLFHLDGISQPDPRHPDDDLAELG